MINDKDIKVIKWIDSQLLLLSFLFFVGFIIYITLYQLSSKKELLLFALMIVGFGILHGTAFLNYTINTIPDKFFGIITFTFLLISLIILIDIIPIVGYKFAQNNEFLANIYHIFRDIVRYTEATIFVSLTIKLLIQAKSNSTKDIKSVDVP